MKPLCKTLATIVLLLSACCPHAASAAVPLEWTARPGEIAPAQFMRHHGETLELRCRFAGFGEPPFSQGADIRLWYQTNGMPSSAWWSVPAQAASNTLSAVFAPESDPGADLVRLFFGAPSNAYASAVLRLRPSPGAAPNALPPPEGFAEADPVFAAWLATDPFSGLAPADYETVADRAMSAVQPAEMNAAIAAIPSTDLTPATNYTDAALASATINLARSVADRYLPLSGGIVRGNLQIGYAADNYAVGQRFVRVDVGGISIDEISEVQYIDVTGVDDQGREIHTMVPIPKAFSTLVWLQLPTNSGHIARTEDILLPVTTAKEEAFDYTDSAITPATNNLRSIEARVDIIEEALDREWNRPGEWELRYSASPISPVLSRFAVVTNDETGVIVSNATVTETQSLAANIYSYPLDELSMSPAPTVTLSCNAAGASLSGSVLTVDTNGVYTVRGTAPDGATRSVQVPMYVTTLTDRHKSTYIADTNGSARAVVNDTMLTALEDAATYEHSTLDYPTDRGANPPGQFTGWRTITPTWAWPGVGNLNPWAIAPKVLVSASHWIRRPPNPIQLYDSVGGTNFFVSVGYWEHLDTWARTNGFTDAESRAADRADICLGGIVEGYVPDACLPYLADAAELDALFGGTIDGIMAWHYPRGTTEDTCGTTEQAGNLYTWCIPVLLNVNGPTADTPISWTGPAYMTDANDANVRADILALIGKYDANNWWRVRGGDSGRPVFIRWGLYDIPVAETHRTTMGGSIPAAATIIRAFCAQHGCTPKSLPH